ncbi:RICIN domain-containing protein [Dactylosporangium vinaceum]|uniref:Arabinofuranosidase catalytic domain-containing protein n=1 Tax=Dactylosporangium vinaceum TaxID=53362 RepID=A0ABV5MQX1_9ACTN|nr:arabinofuranosidase catalytic domain-containing protein [Dactylosporangium vinaceum]UAB93849.1 RICIN domain-containing protein [Dactylosporangium vinaceum]
MTVPIAVIAVTAWPSQAATAPTGGGVYTLASGASGKCIDVVGASTANSALLVQTACNVAAADQQWRAVAQASGRFNLANGNGGRCIDVPSSSTASGVQLQQYGCGDGTKVNQLWTFTASAVAAGKYVIKSVATGLCVSDKDGSTAGNNPIVQETCSDIARMQWSFNYVSGSTSAPTTSTGTRQPCDIYAAGGTPCVAAHSTTRALYAAYSGNLYQVKRASDSTTKNITPLAAGGVANAAAQDSFCAGTTCLITIIYDQSGKGNHLKQAPPGRFSGPAAGGYDNLATATAAPITVGGHKAYGVYVVPGVGYRNNATTGIATGDQPEGLYSIFDGTHYNGGCCMDYGNAETNGMDNGNGTMEAVYFGNNTSWGSGAGSGPWVQADLENGLFGGAQQFGNANNPTHTDRFLTAIVKGKANNFAIRAANAQSGSLSTHYNGVRPYIGLRVSGSYNPMRKEGAIILGTGGDNSIQGAGTWYEGAMTSGYPTDATENAVQANIVAAAYK